MDKDLMWRTAIGGVKTGSFIGRYNILGAELGCKFCQDPLETCQHLILECPGLKVYRDKVIESAGELGCTIRQPPFLKRQRNGTSVWAVPYVGVQRGHQKCLLTCCQEFLCALRLMRNEAHFGTGRGDPRGLIDVIEGLRRGLLEECGKQIKLLTKFLYYK